MGRAKPIMIQGTMSNAGKSLLAAGLCRVLSQDGLRVTPFKSQNMALNSGVTADGLEMGRAQIMQAEACGIAPDVRMNPILLKPESGHRSQLIVAGKAQEPSLRGTTSRERRRSCRRFWRRSIRSRRKTTSSSSRAPAARRNQPCRKRHRQHGARARRVLPVLLAGDIDPGGVFAQLYGTVALLAPEDRALCGGLW